MKAILLAMQVKVVLIMLKEMQDFEMVIVDDCTNCMDSNSDTLQRHYNKSKRKQQSTITNIISYQMVVLCIKFCSMIVITSAYIIVGVFNCWCIVIVDIILL